MTRDPGRDVSRRQFLIGAGTASVSSLALAGCTEQSGTTTTGGSSLSGEFKMTGSSTVYPLAVEVINQFEAENPDVTIPINRTGSGGGFSNHFCLGNSVINNASRPITDSEQDQCSQNDVTPHEIKVASDAVTVIVNNDNDWVECMTVEQLAEIWREDGAQTWSDVDSSWPDEPINRFGAARTSGTFDYFKETIVGEETNHTSDYSATERDNEILAGVQRDKYAIGYFGFAYYADNQDTVNAVSIDNGDGCVEPSLENARTGEYQPLSRPLFTYVAESALERDEVAEFCRFFAEESTNQELVADTVGYVPNTEEEKERELEELDSAIESAQ
ncbi:PstS family phosphate ABC transporter substrate-binding protein [Halorhabdus sp. CBA1104]|uniref:PstS family phosphate ABC transporter substrate-binding protein n=1 Tax=Halorhabdus sp. CBA1104 TaxID=1380432 RepID=UPI0012B34E5F|nr:PstS family phosphate ABC transporter substrate-binding protein [Halorhabdus sp. CBA1104]QGN07353.1 PstS family phosphate ABC transporter substrate-binding protein [Halorhabdus sp. CBA1104]